MFIAMNRFRVVAGREATFETLWSSRDTYLGQTPGFVSFRLLRGPGVEDHTLFASHTVWRSRTDFEDWTKSEAFRKAHHDAGGAKSLYDGHPEFEGFEVIQELLAPEQPDNA
jgi:heme-degrading monooxygenase HmoA